MIIYEREKKTIIIPSGMGGNGDCSDAIAAARAAGIVEGKQAQEAIDNAKLTPSITITDNGEYRANYGYQSVIVNVEGGQGCQGVYDEGYADGYQGGYQEGYEEGAGSQGCQGVYDEGYAAGYQGGYAEGIQGCQGCQGVYDEGYADGYQGGYSAGETAQKNKLSAVTLKVNNTYTRTDGWNSVTVNVPKDVQLGTLIATPLTSQLSNDKWWNEDFHSTDTDGWGSVHLDMTHMINYGKKKQRDLLSSTAITQNGTYTKNDGWSAVTVNVQGGDCKLELLAKSTTTTLAAQETRDFTINGNTIAEFNPKNAGGKNFKSEIWDFRNFYTPYVETIRSISFVCYAQENSQDVAANENYYGNYRFYLQWGGITLTPSNVTSALSGTYSEVCTYTATFSNNGALADALDATRQSITGGTFTGTFVATATTQLWDIVGPLDSDYNYVKIDGNYQTAGSDTVEAGTHSIYIDVDNISFNTQVTPNFGVQWTAMDFDF